MAKTKEKPLTAIQAELLEAMKKGAVCHYMPYMGRFRPDPYYFRSDTMKRCTAAATALKNRGLVSVVEKAKYNESHKLVYKPTASPDERSTAEMTRDTTDRDHAADASTFGRR